MKRLIFLFAIMFYTLASFAQFGIDSLKTIPATPNTTDSVRVAVQATFSTVHGLINTQDSIVGNQIFVDFFYCGGFLTAIDTKRDTVNVGILPQGNYQLMVNVFQMSQDFGNNSDTCIANQIYTDSLSFEVDFSNSTQIWEEPDLRIYPNPAQDHIYIESQRAIERVQLFNMKGQLLQSTSYSGHSINYPFHFHKAHKGTLILKLSFSSGKNLMKEIVIP